MKKIIFSISLLAGFSAFAQDDVKTSNWTRGGNVSLLFNQSAFNKEWTGGGINNYGGNLSLSYDANYKKGSWAWDNKLLVDYGLTKVDGDEFTKKTNDRLAITSLLGKQATETWYYSFFANFQTQITRGYVYSSDGKTRTEKTDFMAPGYLSFGPGMLWKKSDNLKVNIAPATSRMIFTKSRYTLNGAHFGVEQGKTFRYEFGASLTAYAKFNIAENVSVENILSLYSNYLDKPQNVDMDYTMNLAMKVNNYLSANLTFQAIYDDDAVKAFQIREAFGAGLTYKF